MTSIVQDTSGRKEDVPSRKDASMEEAETSLFNAFRTFCTVAGDASLCEKLATGAFQF